MDTAPRGPLFDPERSQFDSTDGYQRQMAAWRESAYEEALRTAKLSPEANRVREYLNYLEGHHVREERARYKSRFYSNRVGKARVDNLALLTDSRPAIEVGSKVEAFLPKAQMIDKVIRAEWLNNAMDLSLVTAADIAGVAGTSFWKIGAARGMMRVTPCGPDMVFPIQPGFHIQQSTAVLYSTYKAMGEVIDKFPMHRAVIERSSVHHFSQTSGMGISRPDALDQHTWQALSPQMRRLIGKRVAAEDHYDSGLFRSVEWQEYYVDDLSRNESNRTIIMRDPYTPMSGPGAHNWWYKVEPGERLYPRKRLIIFAGSQVVYDGPSPFWHGLYPFACLRLNPVYWSFWGLSKYRDLIPINSAMNEIVCGVLDLVKKALNPTVIGKGTSISPAAWNQFFPDAPRQKLYLTGQSANPASDIRYVEAPQLPQYVFQVLAEYLGPEFDKQAGIMDIAAMGKKLQVPGGDTLEQMRDAVQTSLRFEGRFMEMFLHDAGIQAISNILQFYDQPSRMRLIGPDGVSLDDFLYDPTDMIPTDSDKFQFWKNFPITVIPGSLHGGAKDRSKMMYMSLRQMGAISLRALYEKLEIPDPERIKMELQEEAQSGLLAAGGAGARMTRGQRNGQPV